MKKIAIIGANGKQGLCLTNEAVSRGYEVTAVIRHKEAKNPKAKVLQKDLFDLTAEDLKGFDAVIDSFGVWTEDKFPQHGSSLKHLCECLKSSKTRLLIVGGAGCLYTDSSHKTMLLNAPDFPEEFKPLARAEVNAFMELKECKDVLWTYLCPPFDFNPDGKRCGKYKLSGAEVPFNSKGESSISYADYAIAMIDEFENAKFIQKNFSVVSI
ncbi:SDR family oxidoreductase [Treponema pedis]|uniref:SDR family oxidoreductase n=1 Tax=Treponema pedis TaxID=409322 RepID=UPI003133ED18